LQHNIFRSTRWISLPNLNFLAPKMQLSIAILAVLVQRCLADMGHDEGIIGMGIDMYKPTCAYACHDSLSSLYLDCTTFDDMSGDDMDGMDMKVRKRMGMGSSKGTTSSVCRAADMVWLQTFAYCVQSNCAADGVAESKMESSWQTLAADGYPVPGLKTVLPPIAPTVQVDADAMWLNETGLVNGDLYFANRQTLQEFSYQETYHARYA
jgi:hypothetical protein